MNRFVVIQPDAAADEAAHERSHDSQPHRRQAAAVGGAAALGAVALGLTWYARRRGGRPVDRHVRGWFSAPGD